MPDATLAYEVEIVTADTLSSVQSSIFLYFNLNPFDQVSPKVLVNTPSFSLAVPLSMRGGPYMIRVSLDMYPVVYTLSSAFEVMPSAVVTLNFGYPVPGVVESWLHNSPVAFSHVHVVFRTTTQFLWAQQF